MKVGTLALVMLAAVNFPLSAFGQAPTTSQGDARGKVNRPSLAERSYVLGPEDVLQVSVLGQADFNTRTRVGEDGTIQLPYLGQVEASNRTARQLEEQVAQALKTGGYFSHPIVSVETIGFASRNVTVLGSVGAPGVIPIDRPYRLSEILARVGGPRDDGADYVIVRPEDGPEKRYLIRDLAAGDINDDPFVSPGEKIFVPRAEVFYVSGQVRAPGAYTITSGLTLREALGRGGGLTEQGSEGRVRVNRNGKPERLPLESLVKPNDVVVVGQRLF